MIGGVNYYTGQVMPIKEITKAGHELGAIVRLRLSSCFWEYKLKLHEWGS